MVPAGAAYPASPREGVLAASGAAVSGPAPNEAELMMRQIAVSMERGVDPAVLEKYMGLYERAVARGALAAYYDALRKFKRICPPITHDKSSGDEGRATRGGAKFGFTYASYGHLRALIDGPLDECGFFLTFDTEAERPGTVTTVAWLHHAAGHKECSRVTMPTESNLPVGAQQKFGSAMSYGERYAVIKVLGITTAGDHSAPPDDDREYQFVTADEADRLEKLYAEIAPGAEWLRRCFAFYKVTKWSEVRAGDFDKVVRDLEKKRKR